jgi:hypothetical protein
VARRFGLDFDALGYVSAIVIALDIFAGRRQKMAIMNLVWPITGL